MTLDIYAHKETENDARVYTELDANTREVLDIMRGFTFEFSQTLPSA